MEYPEKEDEFDIVPPILSLHCDQSLPFLIDLYWLF